MVIDQLGQVSQTTTARAKTSERESSDSASKNLGGFSAPAAADKGDKVQLSEAAKALQNVEKSLADAPEVNAARVEKIKQDIESGTYQVNAERVAQKFLNFDNLL